MRETVKRWNSLMVKRVLALHGVTWRQVRHKMQAKFMVSIKTSGWITTMTWPGHSALENLNWVSCPFPRPGFSDVRTALEFFQLGGSWWFEMPFFRPEVLHGYIRLWKYKYYRCKLSNHGRIPSLFVFVQAAIAWARDLDVQVMLESVWKLFENNRKHS